MRTRLLRYPASLAVAACALAGAAVDGRARAETAPPRLYIFSAEAKAGAATEEEQGRLDTVADLREALRRNRKVVLVTDPGAAQVHVEVVGREKRELPGGGFGGTTITKPVETIVRLHVTFGERDGEIKGIGQATWGRAAKDAAERLVKWVIRTNPTYNLKPKT